MCGLLGFIGESKNAELTELFTTALFVRTQTRGIDASGFYCVSEFENKNVFYNKKPICSIKYVTENEYKSLWENRITAGIFHCRAASVGVGIPAFNQNNHPFVSYDNRKAVIHNGVIQKNEYEYLKNFYEVETECDSEIILRIFEQSENFEKKLNKYMDYTKESQYAISYLEADEYQRDLYLFRNEHRPLYIADLTKELGQIFFFSTPEIFFGALKDSGLKLTTPRLHEINPHHLFHIKYDIDKIFHIDQYRIEKEEKEDLTKLSYCSIDKSLSEWQNLIKTPNDNPSKYLLEMLQKFRINIDSVVDPLNSYINRPDVEKNQILAIFNFFKDTNKKVEALKKLLEE
jgi:glucosamine 6-phosphate synthetase-like amidotransferase/phosphosugar isomerase protein